MRKLQFVCQYPAPPRLSPANARSLRERFSRQRDCVFEQRQLPGCGRTFNLCQRSNSWRRHDKLLWRYFLGHPVHSWYRCTGRTGRGKGQITPANMRALLLETGEHVTDPKNGRVSPRVNGDSVVNAALSYTGSDPNPPPVAGFTYDCTDLSCKFDGTSSSGTIISHDWTFGSDGGSDSGSNVSHSFSTGGTYEVILTVTDDESASDSDTQSVTVTSSPPGSIALSANSYKVKGIKHADLTWTGALGSDVDIYFDDSPLATSNNDGAYTDNIGTRGGGSHSYQVCEAGTSTCSNIVPAVF